MDASELRRQMGLVAWKQVRVFERHLERGRESSWKAKNIKSDKGARKESEEGT